MSLTDRYEQAYWQSAQSARWSRKRIEENMPDFSAGFVAPTFDDDDEHEDYTGARAKEMRQRVQELTETAIDPITPVRGATNLSAVASASRERAQTTAAPTSLSTLLLDDQDDPLGTTDLAIEFDENARVTNANVDPAETDAWLEQQLADADASIAARAASSAAGGAAEAIPLQDMSRASETGAAAAAATAETSINATMDMSIASNANTTIAMQDYIRHAKTAPVPSKDQYTELDYMHKYFTLEKLHSLYKFRNHDDYNARLSRAVEHVQATAPEAIADQVSVRSLRAAVNEFASFMGQIENEVDFFKTMLDRIDAGDFMRLELTWNENMTSLKKEWVNDMQVEAKRSAYFDGLKKTRSQLESLLEFKVPITEVSDVILAARTQVLELHTAIDMTEFNSSAIASVPSTPSALAGGLSSTPMAANPAADDAMIGPNASSITELTLNSLSTPPPTPPPNMLPEAADLWLKLREIKSNLSSLREKVDENKINYDDFQTEVDLLQAKAYNAATRLKRVMKAMPRSPELDVLTMSVQSVKRTAEQLADTNALPTRENNGLRHLAALDNEIDGAGRAFRKTPFPRNAKQSRLSKLVRRVSGRGDGTPQTYSLQERLFDAANESGESGIGRSVTGSVALQDLSRRRFSWTDAEDEMGFVNTSYAESAEVSFGQPVSAAGSKPKTPSRLRKSQSASKTKTNTPEKATTSTPKNTKSTSTPARTETAQDSVHTPMTQIELSEAAHVQATPAPRPAPGGVSTDATVRTASVAPSALRENISKATTYGGLALGAASLTDALVRGDAEGTAISAGVLGFGVAAMKVPSLGPVGIVAGTVASIPGLVDSAKEHNWHDFGEQAAMTVAGAATLVSAEVAGPAAVVLGAAFFIEDLAMRRKRAKRARRHERQAIEEHEEEVARKKAKYIESAKANVVQPAASIQ